MKKILLVFVVMLTGCSSIKNYMTEHFDEEYKAQKTVNKMVETEISKLKSDDRNFIVNLNKPVDTWDNAFLNMLNELSKDSGKGTLFVPNQNISLSKTNSDCNLILYNDLGTAERAIKDTLNTLSKKPCYADYGYGYGDLSSRVTLNKTGLQLCQNNQEYVDLTAKLENIKKIRSDIWSTSYDREKNLFIKNAGFDASRYFPLGETLLNYMTRTPDTSSYYHLNRIQAFQNVPEGIIVKAQMMSGDIYPDKLAIIYTNKKFVDGEDMYPYGDVKYVGTYEYKTILGTIKRINAYKFFSFNWKKYKKIKPEDFSFYPEVKNSTSYNYAKCLLKYGKLYKDNKEFTYNDFINATKEK